MILSQNGMAAGGGVAMPLANMYPDQATTRPSKLKAHAFTSPAALASFTSFSSFFPLSLSLLPLLFMAEFKRASWGGRAAQQSTAQRRGKRWGIVKQVVLKEAWTDTTPAPARLTSLSKCEENIYIQYKRPPKIE